MTVLPLAWILQVRFARAWFPRACFPEACWPGRAGMPGAVLLVGERPPLASAILA